MPKQFPVERLDKRVPMEVAVQITGHAEIPGVEMTFTQDVSARGARVISSRRWRQNDMLMLSSMPGDFHSPARVAYCERLPGEGYAIGVEILRPSGKWVVDPSSGKR